MPNMKDKKTIKKDILDRFRGVPDDVDYVLTTQWLEYHYESTLTTVEKRLLEQAIRELVQKGLLEPTGRGRYGLKLTEKGANLIH